MKQEKLESILNDIFQLDPKLKSFEKEIRKMVEDILTAQPEINIDANFKDKLKKEIMNKISELKNNDSVKNESLNSSKAAFSFPIHKLSYVAGLTVLVFALVISYDFMPETKESQNTKITFNEANSKDIVTQVAQKESFVRSAKGAFGKLSFLSTPDIAAKPMSGVASEEAMTSGGSTGSTASIGNVVSSDASVSSPVAMGMGGDSVMARSTKIMPPYEYMSFKYVYRGDEFTQDLENVDVYKRTKDSFGAQNLVDFITGLDYGLIDMSKFKGRAEVPNVSFNEDREFGYSVNINMTDNNIFIYSNWLKWPRPDSTCTDDACFARYRMQISDVLPNEEVISIADSFMDEYGIDKNNYGSPIVQDNFRNEYEIASDKTSMYLPDEVSVVYPLKINDALTVDESGNPTGLYVSVNMRHRRVSGLNTLSPKTFEVSAYDAITDSKKLISLAEQGGVYPIYYNNEEGKNIEVSLGTPSIVLARQYKYDEKKGMSDELYVPALSFPVTDISDKSVFFYRKNVIIPLAADMLSDIPEYSIMPMPASPMLR